MFQEIIQKLTNNHDQIITKFQEKIDSIDPYYVLIAELISPTNIRLHVETEYDGGSIEGLCLKLITVYIDRHETHSKDEIKASIENELTHIKERLERFIPQVSENTRLITEDQLEQIEYSQPTDLYIAAERRRPPILIRE